MKITRRQLRQIIKEELSRLNEAAGHENHIRGTSWGRVGAKIENLAKKKSDYNFYDSYSPYGHNHLAVPKSETNSPHKDDTKASPTNDELNKRDMKDSTYFKD